MSELAGAKQKSEDQVAHLMRKEDKTTKAHGHARLLAKNYKCLLLMCERHPAHSKLNFSMSAEDGASTKRHKTHAMLGQLREGGGVDGGGAGGTEGWEEAWALIRASTGIADPDLFIQKHLNCDHLETQLMELKQARSQNYTKYQVSESRLSDLKTEITQLEEELEQTRYDSLSIGGNKEARDLHQRLNEAQVRLKRSKERSDAMENLQRHTVSGLRHICDLLGAPESEDDAPVAEMVRVAQQLVGPRGKSERGAASSGAFPEIDSLGEEAETAGAFVPNREAVKAKSAKTFRAEQRRQARLQKTTIIC
ncbi:unnamed protein product [Pylaiella littoralis]